MNNYLILGTGLSALAAARLLHKKGLQGRASTLKPPSKEEQSEFAKVSCPIVVGPQDSRLLDNIDVIIPSPGIPLNIPLLQTAREQGIAIISEIDLALEFYSGVTIGVTGTNGKSTTVTMLEHILKGIGKDCLAGGNLGRPPSEILAADESPKILALELSSYQLEATEKLAAAVSIFTSFSADHLERHKTLEGYFNAKWRLAHQTNSGGIIILSESVLEALLSFNSEIPKVHKIYAFVSKYPKGLPPGIEPILVDHERCQLSVEGETVPLAESFSIHDNLNLASCLLATRHLFPNQSLDQACLIAQNYRKLAHRFETVCHRSNQIVINDSKSTNVESTLVALKSMKQPCYLLLGGKDKGAPYQEILQLKDHIFKVITFGEAGAMISSQLKSLNPISYKSLKNALVGLSKLFHENPAPILFSPACSSFDEFLNFEERGLYFSKEIQRLIN
ncbi:UDP-N-acetylmuramoyl-L-alanine--D-glutamate ligase [Pseudobacteriovorax antillogorgiicola]|uniref:UDP-N-acetylmuramoylalanine--D-glutamate ligase n=1 Tax=Pseudobacteriovorax antillogorgiicola TaxID=1513793 RepID=A0A1Y6B931_9BACT|nr:UDP-N-acetylmuramoyl-L-alanine--D-glutamate ligase [Pseudobacteriovorax antillogorgiicola]TCS59167.1 UDP-N-acetylmuramoylalanine--D-glutamate ligase [Pseudobacteriovorax antillogorgiicola]SME91043.1 UDP-N-acetylmuramoylalanine--D-glutamate ligase [Pseudobacteriovorax antillogorgiicola]